MKIYLNNKKYLKFGVGKFDEWCVYEIDEKGCGKAPTDIEYFTELKELSKVFEPSKLYEDYIKVYDYANTKCEEKVFYIIKKLSTQYMEYSDQIYRIFCIIYMGMVAEENKKNTKLGKRIKRLGIYYLLIKKYNPYYCANFMRGKNWIEIDELCKEGGF